MTSPEKPDIQGVDGQQGVRFQFLQSLPTPGLRRLHSPSVLAIRVVLCLLACLVCSGHAAEPAFAQRGYYMTFMRMPTFGLAEWREMVDCIRSDGGNTLVLWTAGAFRSKRFPVTWEYNREHTNVQRDFVGELIDYAHTNGIRVLLGFTPFAYDGVNQYPLAHPELKATQKDGKPAAFWGLHSWGYNLCPAKAESQRFMLEYVREMAFEFYPQADGLLIESSDYAICYCADCQGKVSEPGAGPGRRRTFFDHEFEFVQRISREVWKRNPGATILVYPHYFSDRPVPGFDVKGVRQDFDPRWTLFFTPHSAHIETNLMRAAKGSVYSTAGLSLGTPARLRDEARLALSKGVTGLVPSLEPFSCIDGPPGSGKARMKPFHFAWLRDGQVPLNELLMRVNRIAYREYARDPGLTDEAFRHRLGAELFAAKANATNTADVLYLQESFFFEADWFRPSPLLEPQRLKERAAREKWPAERLAGYTGRVERLRVLAERYRTSGVEAEKEMSRIARHIVDGWGKGK